jgi:hypothetical protein
MAFSPPCWFCSLFSIALPIIPTDVPDVCITPGLHVDRICTAPLPLRGRLAPPEEPTCNPPEERDHQPGTDAVEKPLAVVSYPLKHAHGSH